MDRDVSPPVDAVHDAGTGTALAALHGHAEADVEERSAWALAVLVFGDSAAAGGTEWVTDGPT